MTEGRTNDADAPDCCPSELAKTFTKENHWQKEGKVIKEEDLCGMCIECAEAHRLSVFMVKLVHMFVKERGVHQFVTQSEEDILHKVHKVVLPEKCPNRWKIFHCK